MIQKTDCRKRLIIIINTKVKKGYSIRFVADYFGVCDTTLLRRLAKKTQFRKGRPPALSNKKSQDPIRKCRECSHEFEPFGQGSMLWRSCENCPNWLCPDCCSPELEKCKYCQLSKLGSFVILKLVMKLGNKEILLF